MATVPILTHQVVWTSGVTGKLSFVPPYNSCQIKVSCNQHIKTFRCRTTYESEPTGRDKGYLVTEITNRPKDTQIPFTLTANSALTSGDGTYTVGLYVENDDGVWNEYDFFITTELDTTHLEEMTKDNENLMVASAVYTSMEIRLNAGATIDLSTLLGLDKSYIDWGDGNVTKDTLAHTYSSNGTYVINANFDKVQTIKDNFFDTITAVTYIDMTNFTSLGKISHNFCKGCSNLTTIIIRSQDIFNIGDNFLYGTGITSFNMSLSDLQIIGNYFLANTPITSIDLSSATYLNKIGDFFLFGCSSLTTLTLLWQTALIQIGASFLHNSGITTLTVPPKSPPTLTSWGTVNLTSIVCNALYLESYKSADIWKDKKDIMTST